MKTVWLKYKRALAVLLVFPLGLHATLNISADADARYSIADWNHQEAKLHVLGASVRKTFSDNKGDRFTLFGLVEAHDNFSDIMVHEIYGRYKGPLGSWNLTLGRFGLPYGLLTGFSSSRLLYDMPHRALLGYSVDNGLMLSGVVGMWDYGVAVSQGYGPHHVPGFPGHGLGTTRLGVTLGDAGEVTLGVSGAYGRTADAHHEGATVMRAVGGADATLYLGRLLCRMELNGGVVDKRLMATAFAGMDYALLPRLDMNVAVTGIRQGDKTEDAWFAGLTYKQRWFTLRGGYRYAYHKEPHHQVALQIYRLFSFNF
ncbi:MAG: hypothetical protein GF344_05175 [Chitinivibrionales bacterium]|nr:hypothetical protein [Chitinivibrionales bacterium]MBD3356389.1 hypothetical protein [Chitinivibrionales bacterium]